MTDIGRKVAVAAPTERTADYYNHALKSELSGLFNISAARPWPPAGLVSRQPANRTGQADVKTVN